MFRVAESDERRGYAPFCGKSFRGSGKNQKRFTVFFFLNVDITEAHGFAYAGAESFCNRLLAREPRSQMTLRKFHRHRICNFTIGENSVKETISESLDGMLDARAFDNIDADAENTHATRFVGRFCETPRFGV